MALKISAVLIVLCAVGALGANLRAKRQTSQECTVEFHIKPEFLAILDTIDLKILDAMTVQTLLGLESSKQKFVYDCVNKLQSSVTTLGCKNNLMLQFMSKVKLSVILFEVLKCKVPCSLSKNQEGAIRAIEGEVHGLLIIYDWMIEIYYGQKS